MFILGDLFLKDVVAVFDVGAGKMSLAKYSYQQVARKEFGGYAEWVSYRDRCMDSPYCRNAV